MATITQKSASNRAKFNLMPSLWKLYMELIVTFLSFLWLYAGIVKLLDYDLFKIQLSKSPLLTGFPGFVAVFVPIVEILMGIVLLPFVPAKIRLWGYYATVFMMVMFSTYLFYLLNFAYSIPCSCGGILGNIPWNWHIVFNLACAILAIHQIYRISKGRF